MLHTVWVFLRRIRAALTLATTEGKSSAESALSSLSERFKEFDLDMHVKVALFLNPYTLLLASPDQLKDWQDVTKIQLSKTLRHHNLQMHL